MYVELEVPEDSSKINESIEEYFNCSSLVGKVCDGSRNFVQAEKRSRVTCIAETEFFIVILTRAMQTLDGYAFNQNRIIATEDVFLR